jgi:hypothetical protein
MPYNFHLPPHSPPEQLLAAGESLAQFLKELPVAEEPYRQWEEDLRAEIGVVAKALQTGATNHVLMGQLEEEQELYHGLIQTIHSSRRHPFTAKAQAAVRLGSLLHRLHSTPANRPSEERVTELNLLFADFDQAPAQCDLATLDLLTWYDRLKSVHRKLDGLAARERSIWNAKQRILSILNLCEQLVRYQAETGRTPYAQLTGRLEALLEEIRAPHRSGPRTGDSSPAAEGASTAAALNG